MYVFTLVCLETSSRTQGKDLIVQHTSIHLHCAGTHCLDDVVVIIIISSSIVLEDLETVSTLTC